MYYVCDFHCVLLFFLMFLEQELVQILFVLLFFFAGSRESQFFATAEAGLVGTARGEPGMFFVVFVYPCVLAENQREQ